MVAPFENEKLLREQPTLTIKITAMHEKVAFIESDLRGYFFDLF